MNTPATLDTPIPEITKAIAAKYLDNVKGIIIGDYAPARTWALYSKHTRNRVAYGTAESDQDARDQARAWLAEKKAKLGDEFTRLWSDKGFELRIWD